MLNATPQLIALWRLTSVWDVHVSSETISKYLAARNIAPIFEADHGGKRQTRLYDREAVLPLRDDFKTWYAERAATTRERLVAHGKRMAAAQNAQRAIAGASGQLNLDPGNRDVQLRNAAIARNRERSVLVFHVRQLRTDLDLARTELGFIRNEIAALRQLWESK